MNPTTNVANVFNEFENIELYESMSRATRFVLE